MQYTTIPKYRAPISGGYDPIVSVAHWDEAYDAFEAKDYRKSLIGVFNYINPALLENMDTSGDFQLQQAHGSADIKVKISKDKFQISAPFLKIDQANKVAIMRRVAEINFNPLTLAQILLKDDVLWFEFSTELELCQPNKIYEVIREVCVFCDDYDDEFIEKYKAAFYHKPKITPLPAADQDKVWEHFQEIAEQYKGYTEHFEQKRWVGSVWEMIVISFLNIANMSCVNGKLRSDLAEQIYHIYNGDVDTSYRIDSAKSYLKKLFATSKEDFLKNVYAAEQFISLKYRSSTQILQNEFEQSRDRVLQEINEGNQFAAAYSMYVVMLRVLYEFNLDDGHKHVITEALVKAGGKESAEALHILQDVYTQFLEGSIEPKKAKGLFAKLFS